MTKRNRPYEVVLFDVGETLISPRRSYGATYASVLTGFGLERTAEEFDAAINGAWNDLGRTIPPGTDRYSAFPGGERGFWLHLVRRALARTAPHETDDAFADRVLDALRDAFRPPGAWAIYDDVVPVLTALRERGVRLGVVSNWDSRLPGLLEQLGLASFFDDLAVSSLERVEKPDPRIFNAAIERLRVAPEDALHVGDLPAIDLAGARAAGIDARLIDRRGRLAPDYDPLPDLRPLMGTFP